MLQINGVKWESKKKHTSRFPETHHGVGRELSKYIVGSRALACSEACNFLWLHVHVFVVAITFSNIIFLVFCAEVKSHALLGLYDTMEQLAFLDFIVRRWGR